MTEPSDVLALNGLQAMQAFAQLRMQDIRDIRSVDTDLLLVMRNGQQIVWQQGALTVLQKPELVLLFKDGTLRAEQLFKQIETIEINEPKEQEQLMNESSQVPLNFSVVEDFISSGIENGWRVI